MLNTSLLDLKVLHCRSAVLNTSLLDLKVLHCSIVDVKYKMINNSTSGNDSFPNLRDGLALLPYPSLFGTVFFLLPMFIVNILLLVAIIRAKTIPSTIKLILGNVLASSELIIIGLSMFCCYMVILSQLVDASPHDFPCRLLYVIIDTGAAGRLLFMATYAITVYVLARYAGKNLRVVKLRLWTKLLAVVVIWVFASLPNMVLFCPIFIKITFSFNHVCLTHSTGPATFIHSSFFIIVYGLCCFVLGIVFPILTARYLRKNSISENKETIKRMVKFSVFLLIENSIHMIGISFPLILSNFLPVENNRSIVTAFIYIQGCLLGLSLITSLFLLIFFKRIREKMFKILTCFICLKRSSNTPL